MFSGVFSKFLVGVWIFVEMFSGHLGKTFGCISGRLGGSIWEVFERLLETNKHTKNLGPYEPTKNSNKVVFVIVAHVHMF